MDLFLTNASVVHEDGIRAGSVLIREQHIASVFDGIDAPASLSGARVLDLRSAYLAPGMIDLHIHGAIGVDVMRTDSKGIERLAEFLLSEGLTGFFPTLVPSDDQSYGTALTTLVDCVGSSGRGGSDPEDSSQRPRPGRARLLGVHFEGPFVSRNRCGALRSEQFRTFDNDPRSLAIFTSDLPGVANRLARLMTLAPELPNGVDLIRHLVACGIKPFLGHTQAQPDMLDLAAVAGASHITHFPNALDPLHHRSPGAVGWGLVRGDITLDCIADLHHVDELMLKMMYLSKGPARLALISDSIPPAGLGDGEFSVWEDRICVKDGRTSLIRGGSEDPETVAEAGGIKGAGLHGSRNEQSDLTQSPSAAINSKSSGGTLAGSVITLRQAVRNMVGLGIPLHEALHMASLSPARAAGIADDYGSIRAGKRADLIVLGEDLGILMAIVGGRLAFGNVG
jgi:N-acetylglucosamine-6-phosphate deacetylase